MEKIILEELLKLNNKLDKIEERLDKLENDMKNGFKELNDRMDKLEERMDKLEERMDKLEDEVKVFKKDMLNTFGNSLDIVDDKIEGVKTELNIKIEDLYSLNKKTL